MQVHENSALSGPNVESTEKTRSRTARKKKHRARIHKKFNHGRQPGKRV